MFKRKRMEGLLAESLYQELGAPDRAELDTYLRDHPELRGEFDRLRGLVNTVPVTPVELDRDLLPLIRRRLRERAPAPVRLWRPAYGALAACAVVLMVIGYAMFGGPDAPTGGLEGVARSTIASALAQADRLAAERNFSAAYLMLAQAVAEHGDDPHVADALRRMADTAYSELRWYPEAFDAYTRLQQEHYAAFSADPESVERWQLLAEAKGAAGDFAVLHALDNARRRESFEDLESIIARTPATFVAAAAAREMARLAVQGDDLSAVDDVPLYAMEKALERAQDPIARTQLKFEVALVLERGDADTRARSLYREVINEGGPVLARLAEERLRTLDNQTPR